MAELDDINAELSQIETQLGQVSGGQPVSVPTDIASIDAEIAQIDAEIASRNESVKDLPPEWKNVPFEAFKNIPRSTLELGKNVFKAITSPLQTLQTLEDVALGGIQKLIPGEQDAEQTFNATVNFFKERFGGEEELRRTISQDPAGFLTDLSIFVGGIGSVTKLAGATRVGQAISKAAPLVSPVGATAKGISAVANKTRLAADSIIKTAVKFEKKSGLERIDQLANEFINRGLRLDRKSLARLDTKIKKVQTDINNIITKKTKEGVTVETKKIVDSIDDLIKEADKSGLGGVDLPRNVAQLKRLKDDFIAINKQVLTPKELQQMKVGLNKAFKSDLNTRFSQVKAKANDKLRVAAMKELENIHSQLKGLNANQGVMLELRKAIDKTIISLESSPTFPVKGLIAGGAAGGVAAVATGAATVGQALVGGVTFAVISLIVGKILNSANVQVKIASALNVANRQLARAGKLNKIVAPAFQTGRIAGEVEGLPQPVQ